MPLLLLLTTLNTKELPIPSQSQSRQHCNISIPVACPQQVCLLPRGLLWHLLLPALLQRLQMLLVVRVRNAIAAVVEA
jgi:hypothetical protein